MKPLKERKPLLLQVRKSNVILLHADRRSVMTAQAAVVLLLVIVKPRRTWMDGMRLLGASLSTSGFRGKGSCSFDPSRYS